MSYSPVTLKSYMQAHAANQAANMKGTMPESFGLVSTKVQEIETRIKTFITDKKRVDNGASKLEVKDKKKTYLVDDTEKVCKKLSSLTPSLRCKSRMKRATRLATSLNPIDLNSSLV
jgi:hypothetical protein